MQARRAALRGAGALGQCERWAMATGVLPVSSLLQLCPGLVCHYLGLLLRPHLCAGSAEVIS